MSGEIYIRDWLMAKLKSLDIDEDVFTQYIIGILTAEEAESDLREGIYDVLNGIPTCDVEELCDEIIEKWAQAKQRYRLEQDKVVDDEKNTLDEKLAYIMEKQAQTYAKMPQHTEAEKKMKDAILAQYAQVSDDEEDVGHLHDTSAAVNVPSGIIPQNTNVDTVVNAEKDVREKAKAEYEKKKAQDKVNKEKQKQKQVERREKERKRTQKSEHRR